MPLHKSNARARWGRVTGINRNGLVVLLAVLASVATFNTRPRNSSTHLAPCFAINIHRARFQDCKPSHIVKRGPARDTVVLGSRLTYEKDPSKSAALEARKAASAAPDLSHAEVVAEKVNGLALAYLRAQISERPLGNTLISPLCLGTALAMLTEGARGESLVELTRVLDSSVGEIAPTEFARLGARVQSRLEDVSLTMANGIWVADTLPLKARYVKVIRHDFSADAIPIRFFDAEAKNQVNMWFEEKTHGLIKLMFDRIEPTSELLLGNALHFSGKWLRGFDVRETRNEPFFGKYETRDVPMMRQSFNRIRVRESLLSRSIALPIADGSFEMRFVLPRPGVELVEVVDSLEAERHTQWVENAVDLQLPRFGMDVRGSAQNVLRHLGVTSVWGAAANLSGMSTATLSVSDVLHRVVLRIDEFGTEMSASSAVIISRNGFIPKTLMEFHVNQPFLVELVHVRSHVIVVTGAIQQL